MRRQRRHALYRLQRGNLFAESAHYGGGHVLGSGLESHCIHKRTSSGSRRQCRVRFFRGFFFATARDGAGRRGKHHGYQRAGQRRNMARHGRRRSRPSFPIGLVPAKMVRGKFRGKPVPGQRRTHLGGHDGQRAYVHLSGRESSFRSNKQQIRPDGV